MPPLLVLLALYGAVYPKATDEHVNDFAKVLSQDEVERIKAVLSAVRRDHGVPIVVATIPSLAEEDAAGWSIERYATNLYNEWGIGDPRTNRGVLLLVSPKDRKLRIVTGTGLGNRDDAARQVIDDAIVPRLKQGDIGGGIVAGAEAIAAWFAPAGAAGEAPQTPPGPGGEGARWTPHGTGVIRKT